MKIAIVSVPFLSAAVVSMLMANGYTGTGNGSGTHILVNTDKRTFKDGNITAGRAVYNPSTQFAAIATAVAPAAPAAATITRSLVSAPTASASTPVATAVDAYGTQLHVGDTVRMSNSSKTKPGFRLNSATNYVINLITASGKIGLAGVPDNQFLPKRAVRQSTATPAGTRTAAPAASPARSWAVARKAAVDAAGNTLSVGDTVIVLQPTGKSRLFNLRANGVAVITSITAKGALGFAFDRDNQFLAKRFQKVTREAVSVTVTPAPAYRGRGANPSLTTNLRSGDKVIAAPRRDARFALTPDTAYTFRGLTVDGGSLILDGQAGDQYAPSRFTIVRPVGTVRNR